MSGITGSKLLAAVILASVLIVSGCGEAGGAKPQPGSSGASEAPKEETAGAEAFLAADGLWSVVYRDGDKVYSDERVNPGAWELAETVTAGGEDETLFSLTVSDIRPSYPAGAACEPYIIFTQTKEQQKEERKPLGALYFALPGGTDAGLEELTVLEYFLEKAGPVSAPVQLSAFASDSDGQSGGAESSDGDRDAYFSAMGYFPAKVSEGCEIWLVLDLSDTDKLSPASRHIWKFRWSFAGGGSEAEETPEDHSGDPDYFSAEYAGHWDRTDIRFAGTDGDRKDSGETGVMMKRAGSDGRDILCRMENADAGPVFRIPAPGLKDRYYSGDSFSLEMKVYCDTVQEEVPGSVNCSFWFGEVTFDEEGNPAEMTPEHYFTEGYQKKEVLSFGPHPHDGSMSWRNDLHRGYLMLDGAFPEGKEDGDRLYVVFEAEDTLNAGSRLVNIYEYTWSEGPETVWIYNPPMAD